MDNLSPQLYKDLALLGQSLATVVQANGATLYPLVIEKGLEAIVGAPMPPCCYGGGEACVAQGGDGLSHHMAGFAHPMPHISELGGRPENSVKYPYTNKLQEYAATGKSPVVEATEMAQVQISTATATQSPLGTAYVDAASLAIPAKSPKMRYGQPVKVPSIGQGIFAGWGISGGEYVDLGNGNIQATRGSTPLEPATVAFGPWAGLPPKALITAPKEVVAVMKKALQDSPYLPGSGFDLRHKDYVDGLLNNGCLVFMVGGAIRDALLGVVSKDVDIVTDASFSMMERAVKSVGGTQSNYYPHGALIQMGSDKQRALDITCLRSGRVWFTEEQIVAGNINRDTVYRDFACNALYFDVYNSIIIDPTERGIKDSVDKVLSPSCPKGCEDEWLKNPRLGLRFFKMLYKGYTPSAEMLALLTPKMIVTQCRSERQNRGDSYLVKLGHWLLYRQLCGDLYYGTGLAYNDSSASVRRTYKTRMTKLKKSIVDTGYGAVWDEYVHPMLSKHIDI